MNIPPYELRYDFITADECGIHEYAMAQMKKLGYKSIIYAEPCPMADCWFFVTRELIEPLPPYLRLLCDGNDYFDHWHNEEELEAVFKDMLRRFEEEKENAND